LQVRATSFFWMAVGSQLEPLAYGRQRSRLRWGALRPLLVRLGEHLHHRRVELQRLGGQTQRRVADVVVDRDIGPDTARTKIVPGARLIGHLPDAALFRPRYTDRRERPAHRWAPTSVLEPVSRVDPQPVGLIRLDQLSRQGGANPNRRLLVLVGCLLSRLVDRDHQVAGAEAIDVLDQLPDARVLVVTEHIAPADVIELGLVGHPGRVRARDRLVIDLVEGLAVEDNQLQPLKPASRVRVKAQVVRPRCDHLGAARERNVPIWI
jgi:hypothetical protein